MDLTDNHKQILRNAEQLKVTFATKGWETVIEPLLCKMINDCVGYRSVTGDWIPGEIQRKSENAECLAYYSKALIEFQNRLNDHIKLADIIKEQNEEEAKTTKVYNEPMTDTRYNS